MPRLAWFTPLAPVKSGISQYNRELLPALADAHDIDLFVDGRPGTLRFAGCARATCSARTTSSGRIASVHTISSSISSATPRATTTCGRIWRGIPGLVVLHDGQLHHARGRMLLQQWRPRQDDYRREFWFNHPDANPDLAELGAVGLLGSLTYLWPMLRIVVESSRRVLVHNDWLAEQIREAHPAAAVDVVEMGVPEPASRPGRAQQIRARHGIAEDAVVFTAFGKVTPEKRVREAMLALASVAEAVPHAHLLVAGETRRVLRPAGRSRDARRGDRVTFAGYVADEEIDDYLAASDVCLCMRWPTSRETSASWLRCLAAGKPTISTDLVHTVDIPTLDPRNWSVIDGRRDYESSRRTGAGPQRSDWPGWREHRHPR